MIVTGTITVINDDGTVAIECSNGSKYKQVRMLGYAYNNGDSGMSQKLMVGMAVAVFVEDAMVFAIPIGGVGTTKDSEGDISMYDHTTESKIGIRYGVGLQMKAGNYVHMFLNALNKGIYALAMRLGIATDHYKLEVEDKDRHYTKLVIRDGNYSEIANISAGDDGGQDGDAVLNIQVDKDGKFIIKQKQKGEISFDTDGTVKFDTVKEFNITTDQNTVKSDSDTITLDAGKEIDLTGQSKISLKVGSDIITLGNTEVKVNGATAIELNAGANKIKIGPAFVQMNSGSQFIALAIPLLQLLATHTHIDPLSGVTGTPILTGNPVDVVSKGVQSN